MSLAPQLISEIEAGLIELKREYTLFLNGVSKIEPLQMRDDLIAHTRRLRNMHHNRTEDQFRANNTIARVQTHLQLWERQVQRMMAGEGMVKRPKLPDFSRPPEETREAKSERVTIRDAKSQREEVNKLYEEYTKLNLLLGSRKVVNFDKFQNFISSQTEKVRTSRKVDKVSYEVKIQGDKVVVKSRSVKD